MTDLPNEFTPEAVKLQLTNAMKVWAQWENLRRRQRYEALLAQWLYAAEFALGKRETPPPKPKPLKQQVVLVGEDGEPRIEDSIFDVEFTDVRVPLGPAEEGQHGPGEHLWENFYRALPGDTYKHNDIFTKPDGSIYLKQMNPFGGWWLLVKGPGG